MVLPRLCLPIVDLFWRSKEIDALFLLDHNDNTCNVELRPKGIIIRFRSLLETYALVVPYYKLTLFKGTSEAYSVHADHHKVSVSAQSEPMRLFFKKIQQQKVKNTQDYLWTQRYLQNNLTFIQ